MASAADPTGASDKPAKVCVSYLIDDLSADPVTAFSLAMLSSLLIDGPSAPIYKALIDSNVGSSYTTNSGYDRFDSP